MTFNSTITQRFVLFFLVIWCLHQLDGNSLSAHASCDPIRCPRYANCLERCDPSCDEGNTTCSQRCSSEGCSLTCHAGLEKCKQLNHYGEMSCEASNKCDQECRVGSCSSSCNNTITCDQECQSENCTAKCNVGVKSCSQECHGSKTCQQTCNAREKCQQRCYRGTGVCSLSCNSKVCEQDCYKEDCQATCTGGKTCKQRCHKGNCQLTCNSKICNQWCEYESCTATCGSNVEECKQDCKYGGKCVFNGSKSKYGGVGKRYGISLIALLVVFQAK